LVGVVFEEAQGVFEVPEPCPAVAIPVVGLGVFEGVEEVIDNLLALKWLLKDVFEQAGLLIDVFGE
jgi:hypothetical protein